MSLGLLHEARLAWLDQLALIEAELDQTARPALAQVLVSCDTWHDIDRVSIDPFANPPHAKYKVDGVEFKVNVRTETKKVEGDDVETTLVEVFVMRNATSHPVHNLADVGAAFKADPLPGDAPPVERDPLLGEATD